MAEIDEEEVRRRPSGAPSFQFGHDTVVRGLDEVAGNVRNVNQGLTETQSEVGRLDKDHKKTAQDLGRVDQEVGRVDKEVGRVDKEVTGLGNQMKTIKERVRELEINTTQLLHESKYILSVTKDLGLNEEEKREQERQEEFRNFVELNYVEPDEIILTPFAMSAFIIRETFLNHHLASTDFYNSWRFRRPWALINIGALFTTYLIQAFITAYLIVLVDGDHFDLCSFSTPAFGKLIFATCYLYLMLMAMKGLGDKLDSFDVKQEDDGVIFVKYCYLPDFGLVLIDLLLDHFFTSIVYVLTLFMCAWFSEDEFGMLEVVVIITWIVDCDEALLETVDKFYHVKEKMADYRNEQVRQFFEADAAARKKIGIKERRYDSLATIKLTYYLLTLVALTSAFVYLFVTVLADIENCPED